MQKKILIVEDDSFLLELYTHQFTKSEFSVSTASNGHQALEMVKGESFDLVLLDVMLPDISGLDVLKGIAALNHNLPVVMLSNLGQEEMIEKATHMGAKAFIIKSRYTPDQVVSEINSILGLEK